MPKNRKYRSSTVGSPTDVPNLKLESSFLPYKIVKESNRKKTSGPSEVETLKRSEPKTNGNQVWGEQIGNAPSTVPRKVEKLLCRLYEPLVLSQLLPGDGLRISRGKHEEFDLQRDFLDLIAWICDCKHGGDTVTATYLEDTPAGYIFWLAGNERPKPKIVKQLMHVFSILYFISHGEHSESTRDSETAKIFQRLVLLHDSRISFYYKSFCQALHEIGQDSLGDSFVPLKRVQDQKDNLSTRCLVANELCEQRFLDVLQNEMATAQSDLQDSMTSLRHHLGRLGFYLSAAQKLMLVADRLPHRLQGLFEDFTFKFVNNTTIRSCPPLNMPLTPDGVVRRMVQNDPSGNRCLQYTALLSEHERKYKTFTRFLEKISDRNFKPRVHAELILIEHAYQRQPLFAGNDRYIGCSKPACMACYYYILDHPGDFVAPKCHQKSWSQWRPPCLGVAAPLPGNGPSPAEGIASEKFLTPRHVFDVLNNFVIPALRKDCLKRLEHCNSHRYRQPDSTTGYSNTLPLILAQRLQPDLRSSNQSEQPYPSSQAFYHDEEELNDNPTESTGSSDDHDNDFQSIASDTSPVFWKGRPGPEEHHVWLEKAQDQDQDTLSEDGGMNL